MRLKQRPADFKVKEELTPGIVSQGGHHRVYRVTKRKLTSLEAARELADLAGVQTGVVAMAGLKDRQGQTSQFMSVPRGRDVKLQRQELKIETVGFSAEPISSADSIGNRFEITVRAIGPRDLERMRSGLSAVREFGLPNYFDEQRFGNLRHGQGWIALDLLRGDVEGGLKRLLAAVSQHDDQARRTLKEQLWRRWGDWRVCREIAGRFGRHHSVFEHLRRDPEDFEGAFQYVALRERLIHLYAFQSHLWNRAVANWIDQKLPEHERFGMRGVEGKLVFPKGPLPVSDGWGGRLALPGAQLEGVEHPDQQALFRDVLRYHKLTPEDFVIPSVPGFAFKAEPRALAVVPRELRARPAEDDVLNRGKSAVKLEFSLPRGSYATLVIRRLFGPPRPGFDEREPDAGRGERSVPRRGAGRRRRRRRFR